MITKDQVVIGKRYLFDGYLSVKADEYIQNHIDGKGAILDKKRDTYFTLDRLSLCPIKKEAKRFFRKASVFKNCTISRNIRYLRATLRYSLNRKFI